VAKFFHSFSGNPRVEIRRITGPAKKILDTAFSDTLTQYFMDGVDRLFRDDYRN
jgi:hypothetical protein